MIVDAMAVEIGTDFYKVSNPQELSGEKERKIDIARQI